MEFWIVGCLVFVFLALIEYGAVLSVMSSAKQKTDQVEDKAKVKKRNQRKHRAVIGALSVWSGKEPETNPKSNQMCVNPGPQVLF